MAGLWGMASRRKRMTDDGSALARVLNVVDLTMLGVGSTLGLGVYVLAGQVANNTAGPAVLLSFVFAAIASFFAGECLGKKKNWGGSRGSMNTSMQTRYCRGFAFTSLTLRHTTTTRKTGAIAR